MKKPLPEMNEDEKLMLRCYLKNIITIGGLSDRIVKIMQLTDAKTLQKLVSS